MSKGLVDIACHTSITTMIMSVREDSVDMEACPFHEGSPASISLGFGKGKFKCSVCGKKGDTDKLFNHVKEKL